MEIPADCFSLIYQFLRVDHCLPGCKISLTQIKSLFPFDMKFLSVSYNAQGIPCFSEILKVKGNDGIVRISNFYNLESLLLSVDRLSFEQSLGILERETEMEILNSAVTKFIITEDAEILWERDKSLQKKVVEYPF